MENTVIDIDDVQNTGDYYKDVDNYEIDDESADEIETVESNEVNDITQVLTENVEKKTSPYLTKYERTQVIALRAQQLNMGAMPTINVGNLKKTVDIAEKELEQRTLPLMIKRPLPNGTYEIWKLDELFIE